MSSCGWRTTSELLIGQCEQICECANTTLDCEDWRSAWLHSLIMSKGYDYWLHTFVIIICMGCLNVCMSMIYRCMQVGKVLALWWGATRRSAFPHMTFDLIKWTRGRSPRVVTQGHSRTSIQHIYYRDFVCSSTDGQLHSKCIAFIHTHTCKLTERLSQSINWPESFKVAAAHSCQAQEMWCCVQTTSFVIINIG